LQGLIAVEDLLNTTHRVTPFRVLVADDFAGWRLHVCHVLEAYSPQWEIVGLVADGFEALKEIAKLHPDIVLLDIAMPNLNGIDAAKQIRQVDGQIKILFLTMENDSDVEEAAYNVGADGYLLKTKASSELIPAMVRAMQTVHSSQRSSV
jgi:DNA-binding NarL/FixJ family response regulator